MKALFALLLCGSAFAQSPPAVPWFKGGVSEIYPPRIVQGTTGVHIYWFYANGGAMAVSGFSCPIALCDTVKFAGLLNTITSSSNKLAALDKAWSDNIYTCPQPVIINGVATMADPLCRERRNLLVTNRATWAGYVAPVIWRVKPNGAATTRPAVECVPSADATVTGGCIPGLKEVARATIGEPCKTGTPYAPSGKSDRRMEFGPYYTPGIVAVCTKG